MPLHITQQQATQIKRLAKKQCANCVVGKCLLLDGDVCPQLLACSRIICRRFVVGVLPNDKALEDQIKKQNTK